MAGRKGVTREERARLARDARKDRRRERVESKQNKARATLRALDESVSEWRLDWSVLA